MRTRIPNGHAALLCVAFLILAGIIAGCGGANSTYNPALIGGGGTPATAACAPIAHEKSPPKRAFFKRKFQSLELRPCGGWQPGPENRPPAKPGYPARAPSHLASCARRWFPARHSGGR